MATAGAGYYPHLARHSWRHGRYVAFQLAEVSVSRQMFQDILRLIARLQASPAPA
jgi:hypothetical protein